MKLIFYKAQSEDRQLQAVDGGFSLLETAIALTTLGICLAYAMPLFLYAKINNSKSDIQTGALIVAQRVFDNVRSQSITNLPSNDGYASPSAINPVSKPASMGAITPQEELLTKAMGRQYQTKITYCQGNTVANPVCGAKYRQFKVQVSYGGSNVYDLQGTYTEFD